MAVEIDQLQIEIEASSNQAVSGLDRLVSTLERLKGVAKGGAGLTATSNQISKLAQAASALSSVNLGGGKIQELSTALSSLSTIQKPTGLTSAINALGKLPKITDDLKSADLNQFADQMNRVANAVRPLANEMQKVSAGFSAFPIRIQKIISSNAGLAQSNTIAGKSFGFLGTGISSIQARLGIYIILLRRVAGVMSGWVKESNDYVESLNLFNVAMGDAAEGAKEYAEEVKNAIGIDPSEWMRNQGVFKQITSGFGVVADKANLMSKNLTQIGYDISSFFNIPIETAMQKVQSGIAGELEPLRRIGYALDVATLQQIAFNHGIDQSINTMTQAQKSQLRYLAIMEQSNNVMGDMARTVMTPANAMRILGQQITQLTRAFGNLLIPMLMKILPYIQAFVEVLTEAVQKLAVMVGFELPKIDYGNLGSGVGDIEDGLSGANDEAKKLKRTLMGFDELNVLTSQKETALGGLGTDLGIELPEYDFLAGLNKETKKITEKLKKYLTDIKETIEPFLPLLEGVAVAFGLAFGFKWVAGAIAKFAPIAALPLAVTAVNDAIVLAGYAFGKYGSVIAGVSIGMQSLWISFKTFMTGLSPLVKGLVAIIALVAEFVTIKNAVYDLTMGNISLGQALMNIVPIAGLVGVAMYAMLGPWGLVAAVIVGVAAAIAGFSQAQDDLRKKMVEAAFFDGQGIAIQNLADSYSNMANNVANAYDPIIKIGETMSASRESVDASINSLDAFAFGIENGLYTVEETLPRIQEEFETFRSNMQTILDGTYDTIVMALSGSLGDAVTAAGQNLNEYTGLVASAKLNLDNELSGIASQFVELQNSFSSGTISQDQYSASMSNLIQQMQGLSLTEVEKQVSGLKVEMGQLVDINWGTDTAFSEAKDAISSFGSSSDEAKEKITSAYKEITASIEQLKLGAGSETERMRFDELLGLTDTALKTDLEKINSLATEFAGQMQENLISEVQARYDAAMSNWNNLGWFAQMFKYGGNQAEYVSQALEDYKTNIVTPLTDSMKEAFGQSISSDDLWAVESIDTMMGQMFDTIVKTSTRGMTATSVQFAGNVKTSIDEALKNAGFYDSGNLIVNEILSSVENGLSGATVDVSLQVNTDWSSSASKGITDQKNERRYIQSGISPIKQYEKGGFPKTGEMFIANEAGPELVGKIGRKTAVANNDQITTGIYNSVYDANENVVNAVYAMAQQIVRAVEDNRAVVNVGGKDLARDMASEISQINKERGTSLVNRGV